MKTFAKALEVAKTLKVAKFEQSNSFVVQHKVFSATICKNKSGNCEIGSISTIGLVEARNSQELTESIEFLQILRTVLY